MQFQEPRGYTEGTWRKGGHNERPSSPKPNFAPPPQNPPKQVQQDWFKELTVELFDKYNFHWQHTLSQEDNTRLFIQAVWTDGYAHGAKETNGTT